MTHALKGIAEDEKKSEQDITKTIIQQELLNICNELCFCTFYKKEGNVGTKADDDDKCNYAEENAKKAAMPNTLPDSIESSGS